MSNFHVDVITLHPEVFPGSLQASVIGKALEKGMWSMNTIDLYDFAPNEKTRIDDTPYGGGPGMIIRSDVVANAIEHSLKNKVGDVTIIYMSARGKLLRQAVAQKLSTLNNMIILCGRFEGVDQRVIESYSIREISIGDYIVAGGEAPAMVLIESCVRLLPGVLGNQKSVNNESFVNNRLEHSHYTKPAIWNSIKVPDVLRAGNHELIKKWRSQDSQRVTRKYRPEFYEE